MPPSVIASARDNLTEEQKQLADHLARIDNDLRALEQERKELSQQRATVAESERKLRGREESVREREETFRRKLDTRLDAQLREARREIDKVIEELKTRAPRLVNTGQTGTTRSEARAAVEDILAKAVGEIGETPASDFALRASSDKKAGPATGPIEAGARVMVGGLGLEGTVIELHGKQAEVDVRGKRLRAAVRDLRVIDGPPPAARVNVHVDLQPREGLLSELNVIGSTVDEALTRLEKFLDESTVTDQHTIRVIHGHGTGQLRRAIGEFLKNHPLVASYQLAPQDQGGGGATIVALKD
jgi:DNA mismatch repair protein MutS2